MKAKDVIGSGLDLSSEVEMLARFTVASCSECIGDGIVDATNELFLSRSTGKPSTQRRIYIPTTEPAVHSFDLKFKDEDELTLVKRRYNIQLGDEILLEQDGDKDSKTSQLRAVATQAAGRGWMVAVGENEKFMVWKKKEKVDLESVSYTS